MTIKFTGITPDQLLNASFRKLEQSLEEKIKAKFPDVGDFTVTFDRQTEKFNFTGLTDEQIKEALKKD